jgi:cell wall-associated NlpC family hydrolase
MPLNSALFRQSVLIKFMSDRFSKYVLIRFRNGGRNEKGCDCWGLVCLVYKLEFGVILPDFTISCLDARLIDGEISSQRSLWRKLNKPRLPCVVVMRNSAYSPKICNHLGIYIGNRKILHTSQGTGAIITSLTDPCWSKTIEGFYVPRK